MEAPVTEKGPILDSTRQDVMFIFALAVSFVSILLAAGLDSFLALRPVNLLVWGIVTIPFVLPFLIKLPRARILMVLCGLIVALLLVYIIPWNGRKVFLRDFYRIEPGMTVEEVESIMDGYIRGTGWPRHDGQEGEFEVAGAIVYRHATTGDYDSDWGIVRVKDGIVTSSEFSPD